jgi:hypothetical protein
MNVITRALASFKALTRMQWGRTSSWFSMLLGSTTFDYRASAGDGRSNAAVMARKDLVGRYVVLVPTPDQPPGNLFEIGRQRSLERSSNDAV